MGDLPLAIIVDIDGTLSNCEHRRHYVENKPPDWDSFNAKCKDDPINAWCSEIIKYLRFPYKILLVSGRIIEQRPNTIKWLRDNNIDYDELYMRVVPGDNTPDTEHKKRIYEKYIKDQYNILFVLDDRKRVVEMWRSLGLTVLQCAEGNF